MSEPTASDLAADVPHVRKALSAIGHATTCASVMLNEACDCHHGRAEAELDALVARVDTLTRGPAFIPRDTDEKPSDAMPQAGFADWREQAEWWEQTCVYWQRRAGGAALADTRRALDEISRLPFQTSSEASRIARRALAALDKP